MKISLLYVWLDQVIVMTLNLFRSINHLNSSPVLMCLFQLCAINYVLSKHYTISLLKLFYTSRPLCNQKLHYILTQTCCPLRQ